MSTGIFIAGRRMPWESGYPSLEALAEFAPLIVSERQTFGWDEHIPWGQATGPDVVIGHSFGGHTAVKFAQSIAPREIKLFILLDPVYQDENAFERWTGRTFEAPVNALIPWCFHRQDGAGREWPFSTYFSAPALNEYVQEDHGRFMLNEHVRERITEFAKGLKLLP